VKKGVGSSKKKKHSRGDQFEVVMNGIIKELVSAQERNKEWYLELEQKRIKMEEKIFKKEVKTQRVQTVPTTNDANDDITCEQSQFTIIPTTYGNIHSISTLHRSMYSPYDDDVTQI